MCVLLLYKNRIIKNNQDVDFTYVVFLYTTKRKGCGILADQLGFVLFGDLDINKTVKNINSQILQLEDKLKTINVGLNIDIKSAFKEIENITGQISKNTKNSINEELKLAEHIAKLREKSETKTQKVNRQDELKQANAINKALEEQYKLEKDIAIWKEKQEINISKLASKGTIDTSELNNLKDSLNKISAESMDARNEMKSFQNELARVNVEADKSSNSILKTAMSYFTLYDAFQLGKRVVSSSIESVRELDEELTNLAKVTDLNSDGLDNMAKKAFELGNEIGRTGSEVVSNMALFAQAGYSQNDLEDLARASLLYQNVSDTAMSAEESVGYVVAALKAFHLEASSAIDVGSALNSISNKNAVGFENLADGLARTASVYSQSNTSMNELLGLLSGGYEISRNMEKTASGLITISTRLRAVQLQGEEAVMPIAKLQDTFKNMANVDIIDPVTNEFRGTYDILESLYEVWDSLNSLQQESIAFAAAGTRQKSVFLDLMSNFEGVKKAADDAKFSIGSMEQENARYLDSINGRMSLFSSAWSNMSNNFISSDFVKSMVDIGTNAVNTIDKIGVLNTSLIALAGTMVLVGKAKNITWLTSLPSMLGAATSGVTALTSALLSNPLFLGAVGLVGAIKLIDALTVTLDEQREKVEKLENGYSELTSELEQLRSIENPTEANERKMQLLERELTLQEKLLEIETEKLTKKQFQSNYGTIQSDLEALQTSLEKYEETQNRILQSGGDASQFATLKTREADLLKYTDKANETLTSLMDVYDDLTPKQKEQADVMIKQAEAVLKLADDILGLNVNTNNQTDANNELVNSIDRLSVEALTNEVSSLSEAYDDNVEKIELLNKAVNSLADGQTLTSDTILDLLDAFPSLRGEITETNGVYSISKDALLELKNQAVDTFGVMVNDQITATNEAISNCKKRISTYQTELAMLKKLASGQSILKSIESKNKLAMGHDPVANKENQIKQEQNEMQKYLDLLNQIEIKEQDFEIATSTGNTKKGSNISNKNSKSKKDKDSFEKYYSQLVDEKIDVILSENERLEDAIAFAQEKLANAELKGDTKQQEVLNKQILEFTKQKKELSHKMAEELRKVGNDVRIQLGNMNIKGYENFNFANLTTLDVSKITQSYDKAMVGASDAVKANIEIQKNKFQELANVVLRIYGEEIPNLQKQWWSEDTNHRQQQIDDINRIAEAEQRAYDEKQAMYDLELMMYESDSEEYIAIEESKVNDLLALHNSYMDKVDALRKLNLSDANKDIQKFLDMAKKAEQERLALVKSMAEKRRQAEIKANQEAIEELQDLQGSPEKLLDMVMQMLRQETEAKKEELEEQLENKKEALDEEYEAEKEAINKRLELIRKEADERKNALRKEQDERDYNRGLEEKQQKIKDVEDKILALSNDDSIQAIKKRKELEAELKKYKQELEDYQYDREVSLREEAIDNELKSQEEKLEKELENLEDQHEQELDMLDKKHKQEIKKYQDMLSSQKKLREEALRLIEKGDKELLDRLIKYNENYGNGIREDVISAWDDAYQSMSKYGDGTNDVLGTIVAMRKEMEKLKDISKDLADQSWKDFADEEDIRPSKPDKDNNSASSDDKYDGLTDYDDKVAYRDKQLKKMIALGDEMNRTPSADKEKIKKLKQEQEEIAKTIGAYNQGGTWYIMIKGKKYKVRDAVGIYHEGGIVGKDDISIDPKTEEFTKLMKGEVVVNGRQVKGFMLKTLPNLMKEVAITSLPRINIPSVQDIYKRSTGIVNTINNQTSEVIKPEININIDSVTKETLPELERFVQKRLPKEVHKILDNTLTNRGIKK